MSIVPPSFTSASAQSRPIVALKMWEDELVAPDSNLSDYDLSSYLPGELIGWYNGATDLVELFIVASSGARLLRVV